MPKHKPDFITHLQVTDGITMSIGEGNRDKSWPTINFTSGIVVFSLCNVTLPVCTYQVDSFPSYHIKIVYETVLIFSCLHPCVILTRGDCTILTQRWHITCISKGYYCPLKVVKHISQEIRLKSFTSGRSCNCLLSCYPIGCSTVKMLIVTILLQ